MSKLQNSEQEKTDIVYRTFSPPVYQAIHRHNDAVAIIVEHQPKEGECLCGVKLTDLAWAEHMAELLFPIQRYLTP